MYLRRHMACDVSVIRKTHKNKTNMQTNPIVKFLPLPPFIFKQFSENNTESLFQTATWFFHSLVACGVISVIANL